jgi:hypothetical protein
MKKYFSSLLLVIVCFASLAQTKTVTEQLGYPADSKLLIIHADDLGVSHSENEASISAFQNGSVNSGSIMVPCPWFPEIANYATQHPTADLGLHLTLTAEWKFYKWGTVVPSSEAGSLLTDKKFFPADVTKQKKNCVDKWNAPSSLVLISLILIHTWALLWLMLTYLKHILS